MKHCQKILFRETILEEKKAKKKQAFRYFDVVAALSFGSSPMSGTILIPQTHDFVDRTAMASVDTLFGLLADLWPIIHRLASLAEVKRNLEKEEQLATTTTNKNNNNNNKNNNNNNNESSSQEKVNNMRTDFETNTSSIELALLQWIPKIPASVVTIENQADDSRLQSILNNAESHKQAGLVYLYRTILTHPRPSAKVQTHVKQALQACLRVVIFSGPMAALVWPLFTAGCEAAEDVDRNVARTVFRHLETRQGMNNIVTAWEVCEEVWRRTDAGQAEIDWRDVSDDMGREVIFG